MERWQKGKWRSDLARSRIKSLHRSIQSDSTVSPQTDDTTAVISQQFCRVEPHHAGNSIGCKSHSDTWADPSKIAQGLEPAAHNSLFAGSIRFKSDPNGAGVRTTEERFDFAPRTIRFASLRTTRLCYPTETMRYSCTVFVFEECHGLKIRAGFFSRFAAVNRVADLVSVASTRSTIWQWLSKRSVASTAQRKAATLNHLFAR